MTTSYRVEPVRVRLRSDPPSLFEIGDRIDATAVDELRSHLRGITIAPRRLNLACGSVMAIDPVGAALLWLLCTEMERTVGTHIRLVHLHPAVTQKLRSHPLLHYVVYGEDIFQDPFATPLPSNR
jgi:hypothetical protein